MISLDTIADEAFFSKFHFIRLFKSIYSRTPHQYLTTVRIEKAKKLLCRGLPVADVCYEVGFDSVTSFAGLFKRLVKLAPATYQKKELKRLADTVEKPLAYIPNCFAESKGWTNNSNIQEAST